MSPASTINPMNTNIVANIAMTVSVVGISIAALYFVCAMWTASGLPAAVCVSISLFFVGAITGLFCMIRMVWRDFK